MKKILSLLLVFVFVLGLAACKDDGKDDGGTTVEGNPDLDAVTAAIGDVTLGDLNLEEVLADFTLSVAHENGATYTWFSDDVNTIAISGGNATVTRPGEGEDDVTVTLTVIASKGIEQAQKTFDVKVVAVPGGVAEKLAEAKKSLYFSDLADTDAIVETTFFLPSVSSIYEDVLIEWDLLTFAEYKAALEAEVVVAPEPTGYVAVGEAGRVAYYEAAVGYYGCMLDVTDDLTGANDTLDSSYDVLSTAFVSYKDSTNPFTDGTAFTTGVPEAYCGWSAYATAPGGQNLLVEHGVWDAYPVYGTDGTGEKDQVAAAEIKAYDEYLAALAALPADANDSTVMGAPYADATFTITPTTGGFNVTVTRPADSNVILRLVATLSWNDDDVTVDPIEVIWDMTILQAPQDDATKAAEAKAALKVYGIDFVDENFMLPTTGLYDAVITWESSNTNIIAVSGGNATVASPLSNTAVTLTATITVGDVVLTKSFVAVVVGTEATYTYRASINDTTNINPHNETLANASTLYGFITAGLYGGDFDWAASIAAGVATAEGDFTNSASLVFDYLPDMAASMPVDVSASTLTGEVDDPLTDDNEAVYAPMTVWQITIRNDLQWENGSPITTEDYLYAYKMLLDPRLLNARASALYTDLPIEGAEDYATQTTPEDVNAAYDISFDTVGIKALDDYTLELRLLNAKTSWDLRGQLSSGITGPVYEPLYEAGMNETRTVTDYGSSADKIMSYGAFNLVTWEPGVVYLFERNDDNYAAEDFRMTHVRYNVISEQSVTVNEFKAGRLDVAGVGGVYYPEFKNNPNVLLSPDTATFRWATNIGERSDGNTNPMMQYVDFRQAIYYAIDRQEMVSTVNAPAYANQAFVSPEYIISDTSTTSYRGSAQGIGVLADLSPDTAGYNPTLALSLFNSAYAQAVADGEIQDGDLVWVELAMLDSETNWISNNWVKDKVTESFDAQTGGTNAGKFEFRIAAYSTDALDVAEANANFDIMFYAWLGMKFDPIGIIGFVYNENFSYMNEKGWEPGVWQITAAIPNYYASLDAPLTEPTVVAEPAGYIDQWEVGYYDYLETLDETAAAAVADYEAYLIELAFYNGQQDTNHEVTLSYHQWFVEQYLSGRLYMDYEGNNDDYLNILAGMEGALLDNVLAIPLFTRVGTAVYSDRVVHEVTEYHAWMGWGGLKYVYLNAPDPVN